MDGPPDPATPSQPAASASNASLNGVAASEVNGIPNSSSTSGFPVPAARTPQSGTTGAAAAAGPTPLDQGPGHAGRDPAAAGSAATLDLFGGDDDVAMHFKRLSAAMEARMRQLSLQEEQLKQQEAALSAASRRMSSLASRFSSDIITLNVGGTSLATSRRTLTLVPDSLLGTMFSGSWDDHLQRDPSGRVFLDYDPTIFSLLLNWLRAQDMGGPEAPLWELAVEGAREEQLLVLIDFLQLQRQVPCRFTETFSPSLSSPSLTLSGSSAWRAATGAQGDYLMAATAHSYFDVDVELLLEVLRFGAVQRPVPAASGSSGGVGHSGRRGGGGGHGGGGGGDDDDDGDDSPLPNHPMFIGVIARSQLAAVDLSRKRSNASWQSTCHGWWTRSKRCCEVREGKSKVLHGMAFWAEGDTLQLTLEAAKLPGRAGRGPRLQLTNTRTSARLRLDIDPQCLAGFEEQWVVVVGLGGRGDEMRINSARRKGTKLHGGLAEGAAAASGEDGTASTSAAKASGGEAAGAARSAAAGAGTSAAGSGGRS